MLSFESGEPGIVVTSRRGYTGWRLTVSGKQAHSGSIFTPAVGAGAVFETSRILNSFYEQVRGDPKLTFNAGTIVGGTEAAFDSTSNSGTVFGKENVVPNKVIVSGEIRTVSAAQEARTREKMLAIVAAHLPQTDAELRFRGQYSPMEEKPGNLLLAKQFSEVSLALGAGALAPNDPVKRKRRRRAFHRGVRRYSVNSDRDAARGHFDCAPYRIALSPRHRGGRCRGGRCRDGRCRA